jgi:hypothetical protein
MIMKRSVQTIAVAGILGCATLGIIPLGCGGGLGEVTVRQDASDNRPALRTITVERLQGCLSRYGEQLEPGHHRFSPTVHVDQQGIKWGVTTDDIPKSADDFAACTRIVLNEMAIPHGILNLRTTEATVAANEATGGQRSYMGSPAVAVVVVVGLSELVLEAGAYTILFAVTVKVVEKAAEDVEEEGWRAACIAKYVACTAASARKGGNHWGASRCNTCLETCRQQQSWPSEIGNGSCEFWKRNWK